MRYLILERLLFQVCDPVFMCFFFHLQVQKHLVPLQSATSQHHLHLCERGAVGHTAFRSFSDPSNALPLAEGDYPRGWQQQQRWALVLAPALLFWFAVGIQGLLQWGSTLVWQIMMNNLYKCGKNIWGL